MPKLILLIVLLLPNVLLSQGLVRIVNAVGTDEPVDFYFEEDKMGGKPYTSGMMTSWMRYPEHPDGKDKNFTLRATHPTLGQVTQKIPEDGKTAYVLVERLERNEELEVTDRWMEFFALTPDMVGSGEYTLTIYYLSDFIEAIPVEVEGKTVSIAKNKPQTIKIDGPHEAPKPVMVRGKQVDSVFLEVPGNYAMLFFDNDNFEIGSVGFFDLKGGGR